ncbi:MAG: CBS domain-containing protein [Ilumatobacter sp.]|nr:CBS domain-containing protein [Ilumatobacter sp.]
MIDDPMNDTTNETMLDAFDEFADVGTSIASFVSNGTVTTTADTSLRDAAVMLDQAGVGCIVIGTAPAVEGVVSERDIVRAVAAGLDLDAVTVGEIETKELKWATPDSGVTDVAAEMLENYVRHVLVGEDGSIVGVVSMRDLLGAFVE